ncbi:tetraspanin-CD63 receptor [Clonorchis sinensis]|uniref:Tetraspanin-CD63 receptor n=1 Tax=Clonorchis sinensis TaxID=79923 RepID=H2KVE5_CLOSI|nr:tetraspanin-CD63 receptor [Clonorchis sinensis]
MCHNLTSRLMLMLTFLLIIVGGVIMIAGGVMVWSRVFVGLLVQTKVWKKQVSLVEPPRESYDQMAQLFQTVTRPVGIVFFVLGFLLSLSAIIGLVGIYHLRMMIFVDAIMVGVVALSHIILMEVYFSNRGVFLTQSYGAMQILVKKYKSIESDEKDSWTLGLFMSMLNCCGYLNGDDFNAEGTQFTRRDHYLDYDYPNIQYPISCCKKNDIGQSADRCPQVFNSSNSYIKVGCKSKLYEKTIPLLNFIILGSFGVLALELLTLSVTVVNFCHEGM